MKQNLLTRQAQSLLTATLTLICLSGFPCAVLAQGEDLLLRGNRAGSIELGATVDEIYSIVGRDQVRLVDEFLEGMFSPALAIDLPGATVFPAIVVRIREFPCAQFSVWGISVRDPRFRTPEGLGVGSTIAELREAYAIRLSLEEGPSAIVESERMSFALDSGQFVDDTRTTAVWIWPDPVRIREERCPGRRGGVENPDSG